MNCHRSLPYESPPHLNGKAELLARHSIDVSHQELAHVLAMAEAAQDEVDNPDPDPNDDSDALMSADIC